MPDEPQGLHIDTDWKKQAQEEKRKLAEQEKQKSQPPQSTGPAASPGAAAPGRAPQPREMPPASFATLVQSLMTQSLFYLGDLSPRGAEPQVNLDMAKHQIDSLGVLEEKTKGNLTDEEKRLLDAALYEVRMRYVAVSSQYVT